MTVIAFLPLLVCIAGLLIYFLADRPQSTPPTPRNGNWKELGRIMFACGLLVFLFTNAASVLTMKV